MKNSSLFPLFLLVLFISVSGCITNKELSTTMSVVRTSTETFEDNYVQNLTIVLSASSIPDFETCAMEIVDRSIHNTFSDIQFSYDVIGYPSELHGTVYLTKTDFMEGNILFRFSYHTSEQSKTMPGSYNIFQNQEHYQLTIYESDIDFGTTTNATNKELLQLYPRKKQPLR